MAGKEPGSTGLLSSARSFAPTVGSHLRPGEVGGYYIDFGFKVLDDDIWPPSWLPPHEKEWHVDTIQWALGCYERYLDGKGDRWLATAIDAAEHLVEEQERDGRSRGAWIHRFDMPHTFPLKAPWLSAMAQGEAASLLVRAHKETGNERFAEAAQLAMRPLGLRTEDGGVQISLGGGPFFEEYPTRPPSLVLNGAIFTLWGCHDVAVGLNDPDAAELFRSGFEVLAANIGRWDTGWWSLYDLFPHPLPNVASSAYHLLHIKQLEAMQLVAPDDRIAATHANFDRYFASRLKRARCFLAKVRFRLRVPRNRPVPVAAEASEGAA